MSLIILIENGLCGQMKRLVSAKRKNVKRYGVNQYDGDPWELIAHQKMAPVPTWALPIVTVPMVVNPAWS